MISENLIRAITQGSSVLAFLLGIIMLYFSYKAQNGLLKGEFKKTIITFFVFIIFVEISLFSMVIYHFNASELAELIWFGFIYLALILSLYDSKKIIDLGRFLSKISNIKSKKR